MLASMSATDTRGSRALRWVVGLTAGLAIANGCTGDIGDGGGSASGPGADGDGADGATSAQVPTPSAPARLLSGRELRNTIADLVGFEPAALDGLVADARDDIFDRVFQSQTISALQLDAYRAIANEVSATLLAGGRLGELADGCSGVTADSAAADQDGCVDGLLAQFAPLVYRRPLSAAEEQDLFDLYVEGTALGGFDEGVGIFFEALLSSPKFLYLIEQGTEASNHEDLSQWEIASRLSYALCERPPDETLRAAAAAGTLADPEVLGQHAEALLSAPCGEETVLRFYTQWLRLDALETAARDPELYPGFTSEARTALLEDTLAYLRELNFDLAGTLKELFDEGEAWVSPATASFWGVPAPSTRERVALGSERAGILTHPSWLAVTSKFDSTSPVHRGVFVLRNLLCVSLSPPPEGVDTTPPPFDPSLTTRERFAAHTQNPECAGCHAAIDPVGFALEDFDAVGRHRTTDNGKPVDSAGGVPSIGIEPDAVDGGAELGRALADSDALRSCFAKRWLRFSEGRYDNDDDEATLAAVEAEVAGASLRDAMLSLVTQPAFVKRRPQ